MAETAIMIRRMSFTMKPESEGRAQLHCTGSQAKARDIHALQLLGPNPGVTQVQFLINPRETSSEVLSGSTDLSLSTLGTLAMQSSAS